MNVPKLRFKADDGSEYPEWRQLVVKDLFDLVKETNASGENRNVITNSAEMGLIPQREYFDKDIAVEGSTDKYTVIRQGDFVYNPRKSQTAPYGPFNCYAGKQKGIVSPLYFCLRPKYPETTQYMLRYFSSPAWYYYIYNNGAQGGARHDRVGMTNDLLLNIPVSMPCAEEQIQIANVLSALDNVIGQTQAEIDAWEKQKRGVMQLLFSRKVRFTADDGSEFPEWEESNIISHCKLYNGDRGKNYPNSSDIVKEGIAFINAGDLIDGKVNTQNVNYITRDKYNTLSGAKIKRNDILYCLRGSLGKNALVDNIEEGTVASSLLVIRAISINYKYLFYILNSDIEYKQRILHDEGCAQPNLSAKNVGGFEIPLPCEEEQQKIAACLSGFDDVINKAKKELEAYRQLKKGLLQQMFV